MVRRLVVVVAVFACLVSTVGASASPRGWHDGLRLDVVSGPAKYVSGGAARVRVDVPGSVPVDAVRVAVNGTDVTSDFAPAGRGLEGVVRDLPNGRSTVTATAGRDRTALRLVNYPITGPMFSGPHQPDFFCSTPQDLAGFGLAGPFLDANCSLTTRVDYFYWSTTNTWRPYDRTAPRPADLATTPTGADFVIRWERGTIDRFIYSIAVLDPEASGPATLPHWNRKLI